VARAWPIGRRPHELFHQTKENIETRARCVGRTEVPDSTTSVFRCCGMKTALAASSGGHQHELRRACLRHKPITEMLLLMSPPDVSSPRRSQDVAQR